MASILLSSDGVQTVVIDDEEIARAAFRCAYPAFATTAGLDELRARDYMRLDRDGHVYLDFTGAGLPAASHVREHMALLTDGVFGNPHARNPTSLAASALVEQARASVLTCFDAAPDEYEVIFTPNATGALRLVGESYPFAPGGSLLLTYDNHNSVNGLREFARAAGAGIGYVPLSAPDLRVDTAALEAAWQSAARVAGPGHHLRGRLPVRALRRRLHRPARREAFVISRASRVRWQCSGSVQADEQSSVIVSPVAARRAREPMRQICAGPRISSM